MLDDRFQQQVSECETCLQSLLRAQPPAPADALIATLASQPIAAAPYKHALELAFRTTLHSLCESQAAASGSAQLSLLLELAIGSAPALLDATLPFQLLEDVFDITPLMQLPPLLNFLSSHAASLASPSLTQTRPRLQLLKACNRLLRRLSKTEGAEWSGGLLELLSRMMAVDERGGLNVTGKFHTDNHTPVHTQSTVNDGESDVDSTVDGEFYSTLWSLQSYFADPPKLKQPDTLSTFLSSLDTVLTAFERSPTSAVSMSSAQSEAAYFPKYLSGPRLLHLQLQDSTFRRHLLSQALITFQYLLNPTADATQTLLTLAAVAAAAPVRPSTAGAASGATAGGGPVVAVTASGGTSGLTAVQVGAVKAALVRVLQLLSVKVSEDARAVDSATDRYGTHLLGLLRDELAWMRWKHAKAPTFTRPPTPLTTPLVLPTPPAKTTKRPKRAAGKGGNGEVQLMGGAKLSELWSSVLGNEESVRDGARSFAPDLESKMQELLDEDDDYQQRLHRWKARQPKTESVKSEKAKEESKEADASDKMEEDNVDDDEGEPDESELMRKNKQRQWTLLRLLRRYDFPLFQKSDGKLDKVVVELKERRQKAVDKTAKEQSERSTNAADVEPAQTSAAASADSTDAAALPEAETAGGRPDETKDSEGERMEAGVDDGLGQGEDALVPIELERKGEVVEETAVREATEAEVEERVEAEPEREEEDEDREEARSSRRGEKHRQDDDSPSAGEKRKSDTGGSEDEADDSSKKRKVEQEVASMAVDEGERDSAASSPVEDREPVTEAPPATSSPAAVQEAQLDQQTGGGADGETTAQVSFLVVDQHNVPSPTPPATLVDDTEMQTTD